MAKVVARLDASAVACGCELLVLVKGSHAVVKSVVVSEYERVSRLRQDAEKVPLTHGLFVVIVGAQVGSTVLLADSAKEEHGLVPLKLAIVVQVALLEGIETLQLPLSHGGFVLVGVHRPQIVVFLQGASFLVPVGDQGKLLLVGERSQTLGLKGSIVVEHLQTRHISDHVEAVDILKLGSCRIPQAPSGDNTRDKVS